MLTKAFPYITKLGFLLCLVTSAPQASESESPGQRIFTLQKAVEFAQHNNPGIARIDNEREAISGIVEQNKLYHNPTLSIKQEDFGGKNANDIQQSLLVTQPLDAFGQRNARISASESLQRARSKELQVETALLVNQVVAEFYRVLGSYEEHKLTLESLKVSEEIKSVVESKSLAGKIPPIEVIRANLLLSQTKMKAAQAELEHHETERRLAILLGLKEDTNLLVEGQLHQVDEIPSFDKIVSRLITSPRLAADKLNIETQQANLLVEKSKRWPNLSVFAGVNRLTNASDTTYEIGMNFDVPLFDRNQGSITSATAHVAQAKAAYDEKHLYLTHKLRDAYENLRTRYEHVLLLQNEIVPDSEQVLTTIKSSYENGKVSLFEVLDAQKNWLESKDQHIESLIDFHVATTEIGNILGESVFHNSLTEVSQ